MDTTWSEIPLEIRPYLYEVAERLWSGHAAIMVGAGFSRNAIKSDPTKKDIPNWNQLGEIFYEKIYKKSPDANQNFLNVLKLADEVQAAFGRPVLDQLLRTNISDKDFEPSKLHIDLLELPWSDVFTTNYDTLLERSCENVISQKFDVVINQQDLIYSESPRIIKLHGSFPSERPLIITEEDYRTYPKKFAPFVNTVQQSLLENTLCLIGFSGDDPNFLQWIGWINDNLGKENSPKIYLIGLLNLSNAQKRLLESKNIVIVDLSLCADINNDHYKALSLFLKFLNQERKQRNNLEWPEKSKYYSHDKSETLEEIIKDWKKIRLDYPNWLIVPEEQRDVLWTYTERFTSNERIISETDPYTDLEYIYELNWRLEKCLCPILNNLAPHFQRILNRYNPFPEELNGHPGLNSNDFQFSLLDSQEIKIKWIEVSLGLLRFYREEGFLAEWEELYDILWKVLPQLNPDQLSRLYYEKVLKAILDLDLEAAKSVLQTWPINESTPFWEAKKAGLLADFGQIEEAEKILERSLNSIRKRLNLSPITTDYTWVSQESYTMLLLWSVSSNLKFIKYDLNPIPERQRFKERWNYLAQFNCDPWAEKKYFDLVLEKQYVPVSSKETKAEFDIDKSTTTYRMTGPDKDVLDAYAFLRFVEELGLPLSLNGMNFATKTIQGALERIISYSPSWARAIMIRYGNDKIIDSVFARNFISTLKVDEADKQITNYLNKFYDLLPTYKNNYLAKTFIEKVPELLSRLSVKSSEDSKIRIYEFIQFVYKEQIKLPSMDKLLTRLIKSSSHGLQYRIIPIIFDVPVLDGNLAISQMNFPEPSHFLQRSNYDLNIHLNIAKSLIIKLLDAAEISVNRRNALSRLYLLYELNALNKLQIDRFFKIIWEHIDSQTGFPSGTNFYKYAFLKHPHAKKTNPEELFRNYILTHTFDIQSIGEKQGVAMTRGRSDYAQEISGGSATIFNKEGLVWSPAELIQIFEKCKNWWDLDKQYLIKHPKDQDHGFGGSIYGEFRARFNNLVKIIALVLGYQKSSLTNPEKEKICDLIRDIEDFKLPVLQAKAAFWESFYIDGDAFLKEFEQSIMSEDDSRMIDALNATCILAEDTKIFNNDPKFITSLLLSIAQPIKWRVKDVMVHSIDILVRFIKFDSQVDYTSILDILFDHLSYLKDNTSPDIKNQFSLEEKLTFRKRAVKLASALYKYYESRKMDIPNILHEWNTIAFDKNEFGDIINQWEK
jgi:hypothetical protein